MIHIAFVHHSLDLGGSERVSYEVAKRLGEVWGIPATFFTQHHNSERWQVPALERDAVIVLPDNKQLFAPVNIEVMQEAIRSRGITHLMVAVPEREIPHGLRIEGCQLIFYLHSVPYWEAIRKRESARTQGERSWYNWLVWHLIKRPIYTWGGWYEGRIKSMYRKHIEGYDRYITLTEDYREELIRSLALPPELAERIVAIPNTQDPSECLNLDKRQEIIYMGRLSRSDKRIDRLLRIWALCQHRLPDWTLKIWGTGKDERYLKRLAEELRLERLSFEGYTKSPKSVYHTASLVALTSSYEGLPMVLLEAQVEGCIPIAFDSSGGIRALIGKDGEYGRLIKPFNIEAYAEALIETCLDTAQRKAMQARIVEHSRSYAPEANDVIWAKLLGLAPHDEGE